MTIPTVQIRYDRIDRGYQVELCLGGRVFGVGTPYAHTAIDREHAEREAEELELALEDWVTKLLSNKESRRAA